MTVVDPARTDSRAGDSLWLAEGVSGVGTALTQVALPLLALEQAHATLTQVGLLQTGLFVPALLLSLHAGRMADGKDPYRIALWGNLTRLPLVALVPVAATRGFVPLYVLVVAIATARLFGDTALAALVPRMAHGAGRVRLNSRFQLVRNLASTVGPACAGLLIGTAGLSSSFYIDAVSYAVAASLLWRARTRLRDTRAADTLATERDGLLAGWRHIVRSQVLAWLVGTTALFNLAFGAFFSLLVAFLSARHLAAAGIGLVVACEGAAGVALALAGGWLTRKVSVPRLLIGGLAVTGLALALLAAAHGPRAGVTAAVAVAAVGAGTVAYNIAAVTLVQRFTPDRLMGRVTAAASFGYTLALPVGSAAAGATAAVWGYASTFRACGALVLLVAAAWVLRGGSVVAQEPAERLQAGM